MHNLHQDNVIAGDFHLYAHYHALQRV